MVKGKSPSGYWEVTEQEKGEKKSKKKEQKKTKKVSTDEKKQKGVLYKIPQEEDNWLKRERS